MKRFPRAVPGALALMGFLIVSSEGCSPDQSVKPGAPVLTQFTIAEYRPDSTSATNITADSADCKADLEPGGVCRLLKERVPSDAGAADGGTLAKADPACLRAAADWCRCEGDPSTSELGVWNCDPFAPTSIVIATFDRLLDTAPFEAEGGVPSDEIATVSASPAPATPLSTLTDYSSTGTAVSIVFSLYGQNWGYVTTGTPEGNYYRFSGPSIQVGSAPALPSGSTITVDLNKMNVRAKDGKTPFTGNSLLLKDGSFQFKTAAFSATITHPVGDKLPAPDPDAGTDAAVSDAGATDGGVADAAAPPPLPTTGPVPADMNMSPVTITFNNVVDVDTIAAHITVTESGLPFTGYTVDTSGAPTITLTPKTVWAAGKAYTVTLDANTADAAGAKLPMAQSITFVMAN